MTKQQVTSGEVELELDRNFSQFDRGSGAPSAYSMYQDNIRKIQKYAPELFQNVQDRNTERTSAMLDRLQFYGMDGYMQDPKSRKGLENLAYNATIPFGAENDFIQESVDGGDEYFGTTYKNPQNMNSTQSYFSGLAGPATYRHEAWHRAAPRVQDEELIDTIRDEQYAIRNGDLQNAKVARATINKVGMSQEQKMRLNQYFKNNPLDKYTK